MPGRTLVTGSTGFVGGHITRAFSEAGHTVRCAVRATSTTVHLDDLPVERVPLDLREPKGLERAVDGMDLVVHAAGITRARRPDDYREINAEGTRRLAAASTDAGVRRFVLISSLAARGPDGSSESGEDRPVGAYGRSKLEAEANLRDFGGRMEIVVLRPAAVYGPRDTDLLPLFRMARAGWLAMPDGALPLQPVYADDVAAAALAAAGAPASAPAGFGPFPVAEPSSYTWWDVLGLLEGVLGRRVRPVRLPAVAFTLAGGAGERVAKLLGRVPVFDRRRARDLAAHAWTCDVRGTGEALGWRARVPLAEGLERTASWYRKAGWL